MHYTVKNIPIDCDPILVDDFGFEPHQEGKKGEDHRIWPWEMPRDWRTGEGYPVEGVSSHRWAYEFLSRNEAYIVDRFNFNELLFFMRLKFNLSNAVLAQQCERKFAHFRKWGIECGSDYSDTPNMLDWRASELFASPIKCCTLEGQSGQVITQSIQGGTRYQPPCGKG